MFPSLTGTPPVTRNRSALSEIVKDNNAGVPRSICRGVGSGIYSDFGGEVERHDFEELGLKVGGDIGFRDGNIVYKDIKYILNVRINDSVGWCVDRGVDY